MGLLPSIDIDKIVEQAQAPMLERLDRVIALLEELVLIENAR